MSAGVAKSAEILQMPRGHGDTLPATTQHICDEFLGYQKLIATYAVVA
jgi:hypothetical protein